MQKVYVLSDALPPFIREFERLDMAVKYFPSVRDIVRELAASKECRGLVLDVKAVMRAERSHRDSLFLLAKGIPIVRAHVGADDKVVFLDGLQRLSRRSAENTPAFRLYERYEVMLPASVADLEDPTMSRAEPAVVHNISEGGCFLETSRAYSRDSYLYLRVEHLRHKRPIKCLVRWVRSGENVQGLGVRFLDLTREQLDELNCRYRDSGTEC